MPTLQDLSGLETMTIASGSTQQVAEKYRLPAIGSRFASKKQKAIEVRLAHEFWLAMASTRRLNG
jgi:hypothetical protein